MMLENFHHLNVIRLNAPDESSRASPSRCIFVFLGGFRNKTMAHFSSIMLAFLFIHTLLDHAGLFKSLQQKRSLDFLKAGDGHTLYLISQTHNPTVKQHWMYIIGRE